MTARYRHVIWDWNGTLLNDVVLCVELFNAQLASIGRPPVTLDEYRNGFRLPISKFYHSHGFPSEGPLLERTLRDWMDNYERRQTECRLHAPAKGLLEELHRAGVTQSVLSAHQHDKVVAMLEHTGIAGFFPKVRGLDDHRAHSKLENGRALFQSLGAHAREVVMVGDTSHDFEVAEALGVDCVLVAQGFQDAPRLRAHGVPVVGSLDEARAHLFVGSR